MKRGAAMEGFIREDGTIRPIEHYDDTELRGKIQTNTDNISNLDSRVAELEEHGGVEDPTKADKVEGATAGNLASLDENGNLQDSGKAIDTMPTANSTNLVTSGGVKAALDGKRQIRQDDPGTLDHAIVSASANDGDVYIALSVREDDDIQYVRVTHDNMPNLQRALEDPDTEPTEDSANLVTSGGAYAALGLKEDEHPILALTLQKTENGKYPLTETDAQSLSSFVSAFPDLKTIPCLVNIDEVAIPAFVSRRDKRIGSNGPIRNFVLLSFSNRLFITNPSITTDNFWEELNEDMVVIPVFAIRVVDYTDFSLKDDHFSENALIDMRDNIAGGNMIRCRVMMDVVHNEGHGYLSDVSNAKLDGYIMWKNGSEEGEYVYTILLGSSLFTLTSDDENLGSTAFVRNADFRL